MIRLMRLPVVYIKVIDMTKLMKINASFADCHGQETALMPLMDIVMI